MNFTSFILPLIVRERKDFIMVKIKKNTNLYIRTKESIQYLRAVLRWSLVEPKVLPQEILCFPLFFPQDYYTLK